MKNTVKTIVILHETLFSNLNLSYFVRWIRKGKDLQLKLFSDKNSSSYFAQLQVGRIRISDPVLVFESFPEILSSLYRNRFSSVRNV